MSEMKAADRWNVSSAGRAPDEPVMILDGDGRHVATVYFHGRSVDPLPDALKMAAAPDLLEALRGLSGSVLYGFIPEEQRANFRPLFDAARAAIAKAEGA